MILVLICIGIEGVLQLSDLGWIDAARLRSLAYTYGGFWPGLLRGWTPNYPAQPYLMFLSYGFLHGGVMHLVVNMATLWSLGHGVIGRVGTWAFLALYAATILGGGIGFALLAPSMHPMVGASGALFGILGALLSWAYIDLYSMEKRLWPVGRAVLGLIALNLVLWWAMDGQLAWETHLGGFVAGWVTALLLDPRPRDEQDDPET